MSLNWKEINLIMDELALGGMQIQKAVQSAYDVLSLKLYGKNGAKTLLISLSPGACRMHETFDTVPKNNKPLRFVEFLNSRIVNGRIEEALQIGTDRIVRLAVRCNSDSGEKHYLVYLKLWSNAANVIVTDTEGKVLDAMKRRPKKGEITGGYYRPETETGETGCNDGNSVAEKPAKEYRVRDFPEALLAGLSTDASFNQKIDAFYRKEGGGLSLDALREEARRKYEGSIDRITASLETLKEKEADLASAERYREYGDIIYSNLSKVKIGSEWLETESFSKEAGILRIKLDPHKSPAASAEDYYEQYKKAKSGLVEVQNQIAESKRELLHQEETLEALLSETNPLVLHKLLKAGVKKTLPSRGQDSKRPGLCFRRKDWLIIVGRDAAENDALLRKHVKGSDLWLHARDYPGSYVFIKHKPGKTVPLEILLDAGNLAIFYSKGRNNGEGDLFYTQVKYLRRAKGGPKGLVIPTQEKNLHVKVETGRLRELEECKE